MKANDPETVRVPLVAELDAQVPKVADAIHTVMREAYRVEAGLLGLDDFPPLRRSVADIAGCGARFFGITADGALVAAAEVQASAPGAVNIDALVVHPAHFRAGLGTALLRAIVEAAPALRVTVSTAVANAPALALYRACGFREQAEWETSERIAMVTFVRDAGSGTPGPHHGKGGCS